MNPPTAVSFIDRLSRSRIYRDYERAFSLATELPLSLRPPEAWSLVQHGRPNENSFCALIAQSQKGCAACLENQKSISDPEVAGAVSATCFAGLCDTAVPVRMGTQLLGFLQTGQVALRKPTAAKFERIARKIVEWGVTVDLKRLEDAYFHSRVVTPKQYAGIIRLLEIFATHLGAMGNQILLQEQAAESPFTTRAKAYVSAHHAEPLTLQEIAGALHVSTFYFCRMFKKATGMTFTDYLGRVRIEHAKLLLLDRNRRVSEIAYEVGFGSLTHFNRLFRQIEGVSPSAYREKAACAAAPRDNR